MNHDHDETKTGVEPEGPEGTNSSSHSSSASNLNPGIEAVKLNVIGALKTVYDPEIPVDIYELGLIYELEIDEGGVAHIIMTLTTPMCPAAEVLPPEVEAKAREVEGITDVQLELVWEPPWDMEMMSPAAKLALNV